MTAPEAVGAPAPLPDEAWRELLQLLAEHLDGWEIRPFGSRVSGAPRRFSDLDLAVMGGPVPPRTLGRARLALSESRLPVHVDLVDWATADPGFRASAEPLGAPLDLQGAGRHARRGEAG